MVSYNQIIKLLRDFSDNHFILKSYGNGEPWELVENSQHLDLEYPMMWVQDQPNNTVKGEETFKFRIFFLNQVATLKEKTATTLNETNINEVKSDMRQCALDFIGYMAQDTNYPELEIDRNVSIISFVDDFNDKLTGWYIDINIKQIYRFSACNIPMSGTTPPPIGTCDPAIININSVLYGNVPSGGTENVVVKDEDGNIVGSLIGGEWIVPSSGGSYPISYVRDNGRYQITEFLTYDIKWYKDNTTVFDYTVEGIKPILDSFDETKLINNNAFGNLERVTNDLGGTVFNGSDGSTIDYLVDHYTGLGWYLNDIYIGSNNWIGNNLMMQTFTYGGFSDWRLPTREDINQISTTDGLTTLLTPYKTFSKFLHYLLDSGSAVSITFWWEGKSYLDPARFTSTNPNTNFTNVSSLAVRNHF